MRNVFSSKARDESSLYMIRRIKEAEAEKRKALYDAEFYKSKMIQYVSKMQGPGTWAVLQKIEGEKEQTRPQDMREY
jgi:hypothetical protein